MNKEFRNIRVKKGTFYTASKTPLEGYKEIEYEDRKTKENKKTYHKELREVKGVLNKIDIHDGLFGKTFRIFIEDEEFINAIEMPLKNGYKNISEYVRSVVQIMDNLTPKESYTLFVNKKNQNAKRIPYKNIVVMQFDEQTNKNKLVSWAIQPKEFPAVKIIEDVTGDKEFDKKERDEFILKKLVEGIQNFESKLDDNNTEEVPVNSEDVVEVKSDDFNELPF